MTDDIVARMRYYHATVLNAPPYYRELLRIAADEIERMRKRIAELEADEIERLRNRIAELEAERPS